MNGQARDFLRERLQNLKSTFIEQTRVYYEIVMIDRFGCILELWLLQV